jgi:hypothetical protein
VVARSSTRASESKPSCFSHQRRSQEEQLWRATCSPLTTISITTSSLVWQLGHFIRTCSLSRLGLSAGHPRGHPVRDRRTATDCIGRSMWGALGARRLLAAISPFWLLVRGWPSSAPPRCGVRAQAPRRPHQLGRHQLRRLHLCRHARLNCPGRLSRWRTRPLGGQRRTSPSAPSGCRRDARRAATAPPCRSRRQLGHQARRSEPRSRTRARRRVPWRSQDEHS